MPETSILSPRTAMTPEAYGLTTSVNSLCPNQIFLLPQPLLVRYFSLIVSPTNRFLRFLTYTPYRRPILARPSASTNVLQKQFEALSINEKCSITVAVFPTFIKLTSLGCKCRLFKIRFSTKGHIHRHLLLRCHRRTGSNSRKIKRESCSEILYTPWKNVSVICTARKISSTFTF